MALGLLVEEFDLWMPDYAGATVQAYQAGTTTPAHLFADEAMTVPATNPQTLLSFTDAVGIEYGKFNGHIYSQEPYELSINTSDQTGIRRIPLTDLVGVVADQATVVASGASAVRALKDRFADVINVLDYGSLGISGSPGASAATNNATLTSAIGAAAAAGGGFVVMPAGAYEVTGIQVPGNVIVCGRGKGVTTLICKTGGNCFTITGAHAGFRHITLDGVNLVLHSVGLTGFNLSYVDLWSVEVKRFETGILFRGASFHRYRDLDVENCVKNVRLLGDANASGGNNGGPFQWLDWDGGQSSLATDTAIEFSQVDQPVSHCRMRNVAVTSNAGTTGGVLVYGAQFIDIVDCEFGANTLYNLWVRDSSNAALPSFQSAAINIRGGLINGGTVLFDGLAKNVFLQNMDLQGVTIQLNDPTSPIIAIDCIESGTTLQGDTTKFERQSTRLKGTETGLTTSATPVVGWQRALTPGEVILVEASVSAIELNGAHFGAFKVVQAAHQAAATLNYQSQSANYTVGNTIKGASSGAQGTIVADSDSGTSGTVSLVAVTGTFIDGEIIAEISPGSGSAHVNGAITIGANALMGSLATVYSNLDSATGWTVTLAASGQYVQVVLTGAASMTVLWTVSITETAVP